MPAISAFEWSPQANGEAQPSRPTRVIDGVAVARLCRQSAIATVLAAISERRHLKLAFCNANLLNLANRTPGLRQRLGQFLVLPDGIGIDLASKLIHGAAFPDNLNGTDLIPALLAAARPPLRVGLLGGRPGVAERAVAELQRNYPTHRFNAISHGFFAPEAEADLLAGLAAAPPDLLLVAFGNPRQEEWIADRLSARHCLVAAGVGALFDFMAGEVTRAPPLFRRLRIEWLYRLWQEPHRLWRRYVIGNPVFLVRVLRQRFASTRSGS